MKQLRMTLAALGLSAASSLALAAGNPLSVHVLNLENGLPSPGVTVTLEKNVGQNWHPLAQGVIQLARQPLAAIQLDPGRVERQRRRKG
mgnify:CR=1 FL=1